MVTYGVTTGSGSLAFCGRSEGVVMLRMFSNSTGVGFGPLLSSLTSLLCHAVLRVRIEIGPVFVWSLFCPILLCHVENA